MTFFQQQGVWGDRDAWLPISVGPSRPRCTCSYLQTPRPEWREDFSTYNHKYRTWSSIIMQVLMPKRGDSVRVATPGWFFLIGLPWKCLLLTASPHIMRSRAIWVKEKFVFNCFNNNQVSDPSVYQTLSICNSIGQSPERRTPPKTWRWLQLGASYSCMFGTVRQAGFVHTK